MNGVNGLSSSGGGGVFDILEFFKDTIFLVDDFICRALDNVHNWATVGAGASYPIVAETILRLQTAIGIQSASINYNTAKVFTFKDSTIWEFRQRFGSITNTAAQLYLVRDGNNYCGLHINTAISPNWFSICNSLGAPTTNDTGIPLSTTFKTFRIEYNLTSVKFYIDDVLVDTITTTIPTGDYEPTVYVSCLAVGESKYMDLDYVIAQMPR